MQERGAPPPRPDRYPLRRAQCWWNAWYRYLAPAITRRKISRSSLITWRNSSAVFPTGDELRSLIRLITTGSRIARPTSVRTLSRTSAGIFDDAIRANQVLLSNPGRPDSAKVGASGALGSRVGLDTASSRTLPS